MTTRDRMSLTMPYHPPITPPPPHMTHRQNLGILLPTTPLTMGPECMPTRSSTGWWLCGISTCCASATMALAKPKTPWACLEPVPPS